MCGLIGVFGNIGYDAQKMFSLMHNFDVCRGRDGAGIYFSNKNQETCGLVKCQGLPDDLYFIYEELFDSDETLRVNDLRLLMGHNRAATRGTVNDENAHPFELDRIVGAHNGTLTQHDMRDFPDYQFNNVDSLNLYQGINAMFNGHKKLKNFQKVVSQVNGAMALTFWDKAKEHLFFYRNDKRTLYIAQSKNKDLLVWASEKWMITVAASMAQIELLREPFILPENHYVSVRYKEADNELPLGKVYMRFDVEIKQPVIRQTWQSNTYGYQNHQNNQNNHGKGVTTPPPATVAGNGNFVLMGKVLTRVEFENHTKLGCSYCQSPITYEDRNVVKWFDIDTPLCESCCKDEELVGYINGMFKLESGHDVH